MAISWVSGCDEMGKTAGPKPKETQSVALGSAAPAPSARRRSGGGDVEVPDVFSATDQALWDGRPSLGGIWVASPDAVNPERVIIRNTGNGKSVTGALFRRERENPGPPLQMSSDAAEALGLLAGQPATVSVTALRRDEPVEEVVAKPTAELAAADEVDTAPSVEPGAEPDSDVGSVAAAAIDKAEGVAPADDSGPAPAADATAATSAESAPQPAKKGFLAGLFKPRTPKGDPGAPLSAIAVDSTPTAVTVEPTGEAAAPEAVETAPLDSTPAAATRNFRYAIGAFSVEANAQTVADALGKAGFTASIQPGKSGEKPIWAVYASGTGDQADLLSKIKEMGFKDAYLVK
jgi:rare lipoprotein A